MLSSPVATKIRRPHKRRERSVRRNRRRPLLPLHPSTGDHQAYHLATGYDIASRTTSMTYTGGSGTVLLAAYRYAYDAVSLTDFYSYNDTSDSGGRTSDYTTWARAQYAYNPDGWLSSTGDTFSGGTSLVSGGGPPAAATYTNWTSAPTTDTDRGYDNNGNPAGNGSIANRLLFDGTYHYQYDANGNRTAKFKNTETDAIDPNATDITIYGWDNRNRMISLKHYADWFAYDGATPDMDVQETYDALDRLVEEKDVASGGTIDERYVWDGESLLAVLDSDDNVTERELNGPNVNQVFATEMAGGENPGVNWELTDAQQSTRDVVRATVSDGVITAVTLVNHLIYNSFGALAMPQSATDPQLQTRMVFTGFLLDPASGMDRSRTRIYDPGTSTWIQPDFIQFGGGDTNLYRYCGDSPTNYVDPSGMASANTAMPKIYPVSKYIDSSVLNPALDSLENLAVDKATKEHIANILTKLNNWDWHKYPVGCSMWAAAVINAAYGNDDDNDIDHAEPHTDVKRYGYGKDKPSPGPQKLEPCERLDESKLRIGDQVHFFNPFDVGKEMGGEGSNTFVVGMRNGQPLYFNRNGHYDTNGVFRNGPSVMTGDEYRRWLATDFDTTKNRKFTDDELRSYFAINRVRRPK